MPTLVIRATIVMRNLSRPNERDGGTRKRRLTVMTVLPRPPSRAPLGDGTVVIAWYRRRRRGDRRHRGLVVRGAGRRHRVTVPGDESRRRRSRRSTACRRQLREPNAGRRSVRSGAIGPRPVRRARTAEYRSFGSVQRRNRSSVQRRNRGSDRYTAEPRTAGNPLRTAAHSRNRIISLLP